MLALNKKIILASASPRRSFLLTEMGITHEVRKYEFKEDITSEISPNLTSLFLAEEKARQIPSFANDELIITADTIVLTKNTVLGKPKNEMEAVSFLNLLSGSKHQVISGVALTTKEKQVSFKVSSDVFFKPLSESEISYYIKNYQPYDKAGSYGIQEWIGMIGISKIEGSYFNIMGLPTVELFEALSKF